MAEAAPVGGALDEPRDVGEHELVLVEAHHAEVRLERGEGVVGDLRLRRAHRRDERRLPGVGEPDECGVGEQLDLEAEPPFLAVLALLGETRRPPRVREEARVAAPAPPAVCREEAVTVVHEVGEQFAVAAPHDRAFRDRDHEVVTGCAVTLLPRAVRARRCPAVRVVAEREQRGDVAIGDQVHVPSGATVAAVGTALGCVRLAPERDDAGSSVAAAHVHLDLVDEVARHR